MNNTVAFLATAAVSALVGAILTFVPLSAYIEGYDQMKAEAERAVAIATEAIDTAHEYSRELGVANTVKTQAIKELNECLATQP